MKKVLLTIMIFCLCSVSVFAKEDISAESYVLIETSTKTVLSSREMNKKREPASTTKIMTALVAIENASLDKKMKVSKNAAEVEGSQIGLLEGEELSLNDLLHILLMKSGNDAAIVIAENVSGSVDKFAGLMNKKAEKIGCENTHFSNPHGLSNESHYTTALDLAKIAAEALKNKTFAEIVSCEKYTLDYHNLEISNSNRLLRVKDYFTGVKTGFTKSAGRCLVTSAKKDGVELVAVTLNDGNDWNDHLSLMEEGFSRIKKSVLYKKGEYTVFAPVMNGKETAVFSNAEDIVKIEIDKKPINLEIKENLFPVFFAPLKKYSYGGYLSLVYENNNSKNIPLSLEKDIEIDQLPDSFELFLYNLRKILKMIL